MGISVLLVDDHALMRKGLRLLVEQEEDMSVVGEASDGHEAVELAQQLSPDVVVMDITMPGLNGVEATRQILSANPKAKVLALSIHSGRRFVEDMLQAGAAGYILKASTSEDLGKGIRTVMRGEVYLSSLITGVVVSQYMKALSGDLVPAGEAELGAVAGERNLLEDADAGIPASSTTSAPLLATKFHRPVVAPDILPRPRLLDLLAENSNRPLTLMSAPAGYGKSTLASRWLEGCDYPSAWISLDDDDGDLRAFLRYVLAAVNMTFPAATQKTQDLLGSPQLPPVPVLARYLLNDLDEVDEPFFLVLDDYHCIRDRSVHDLLTELLTHQSHKMRLVLLTRRDPPLPLSTLRARGQMTEIRVADLRFTASETATFLECVTKVVVDDTTANILEEKTEGWVTGLRLAALSLRDQEDLGRLARDLHGGFRHIADYLVAEVVSRQPPEIAECMMAASLFDRFCASLCTAVHAKPAEALRGGGGVQAKEFMEWLEKANLFVIPLDERHQWLRYHHLFQQLLKDQLKRHFSPYEIAALHARASKWFAAEGLVEEAIDHALAAGDTVTAAEIVEANRMPALDSERWYDLAKWLTRLPEEVRQQRLGLLLAQAWIAYQQFRLAEIPTILERIEAVLDEDSADPMLLRELDFLRGYLCFWQGQPARCLELCEKALDGLPESPVGWVRSDIELFAGLALYVSGRKEEAIRRFDLRISNTQAGEEMLWTRLVYGLAVIQLLSGDMGQASQEMKRLGEGARQAGDAFVEAWSFYLLGNLTFQSFDLTAARHQFSLAVEQRYILHTRGAIDALAGLAITHQLMGQPDEVAETVRKMLDFTNGESDPHLAIVRSCQARLALLRGELDSAISWQVSLRETPAYASMLFFLEIPCVTECRVLVAIGSKPSLREATEKLQQLRQMTGKLNYNCQTIEIAALQALALHGQNRLDEALETLRQAVVMAAPGGSIRPFVEPGPPMADLLSRLSDDDPGSDFVGRILAAFDTDARGEATAKAEQGKKRAIQGDVEAVADHLLTPRELELLPLVAEGLSNKEIARRLHIATETVKTHLRNLYQKLDVDGRIAAIKKAGKLRLLPRD